MIIYHRTIFQRLWDALRECKPKRYVNVQKRGVRVPMMNSAFLKNAVWIPQRVDLCNLNAASTQNAVLRKNELLAVNETGQFKVGDGVTPFKDLPWATRLPVIDYTQREEIK